MCVGVEAKNYYSVLKYDEDEDEVDSYYSSPLTNNVALVGAGLGQRFERTSELKTLNYSEAMASDDKEDWENEIDLEDDRMNKHKAWHPVPVY